MIDKILEMYDAEIKDLEIQMREARGDKNMRRYEVLSAKWEELFKLFNETLKLSMIGMNRYDKGTG